jgi:hypothetical protein
VKYIGKLFEMEDKQEISRGDLYREVLIYSNSMQEEIAQYAKNIELAKKASDLNTEEDKFEAYDMETDTPFQKFKTSIYHVFDKVSMDIGYNNFDLQEEICTEISTYLDETKNTIQGQFEASKERTSFFDILAELKGDNESSNQKGEKPAYTLSNPERVAR